MLSTTAIAAPLTDYFFANGYSKPESITSIQAKVDSGQYYNYPYVVGGGVSKGLFSKKLTKGTAIPQIKNIAALQAALDKEQVVLVADADGGHSVALPIFVEIAKQNGVSVDELMSHLVINEMPSDDNSEDTGFFSNIDTVVSNVQSQIDEVSAEINNQINDEITAEVTEAVAEAVAPAIEEAMDSISALEAALADLAASTNIGPASLAGVAEAANTISEAVNEAAAVGYVNAVAGFGNIQK